VKEYRDLVVNPGCTWMRPDVPTIYKTNFAIALLLAGRPAGCLQVLDELRQEEHPAVQRLRAVMSKWEQGLSFWQKLNWYIGKIEPNRPVTIDFTPGDLSDP